MLGSIFWIEARRADRPAVGADLAGIVEDGRQPAREPDLVGPAVLLADPERRLAGDVGRQRGTRGQRLLVGAEQALAVLPGPAEDPDRAAVERPVLLLVEVDRFAETDQEHVGARDPQPREDLLARSGVELGCLQLLQDRAERDLAVVLVLEKLLIVPERDAVADLAHLAG